MTVVPLIINSFWIDDDTLKIPIRIYFYPKVKTNWSKNNYLGSKIGRSKMAGRLIDQRIFRPHIHHYFVITVGYHNMTYHHYQLYHAEIHRRLATVSRRRITLDPISAGNSQSDKLGEIGQIKLAGYAETIHIADFY